MRANYKLQRLFVEEPLSACGKLDLDETRSHYLKNVLRMNEGSELLLFNGKDGEWRAKIYEIKKKIVVLELVSKERGQAAPADLVYCFAPLKHARLDYMVQKAVEMGASVLQPVITRFTQVTRLNEERMQANIIEACEQCGVLSISSCRSPVSLGELLKNWQQERHLIFCDEAADTQNPLEILKKMPRAPLGVLIGPEGGFSDEERSRLKQFPFVHAIPLGPRILRADTAAVAALAVIDATLGDWRDDERSLI
ncbi:16S rRNA (uracil(1498)-N(3))-methyltransferase [Bartonella apis]|uniref:16S rRNA (uracil(1498)-N(3))-methyltransferase n=1 Tax=Bartonella apis TaxID=1686310 RepID=UPI00095BE5DC|nr:16S rRNA (uracil(1498)-N(3))-methyltransferase [Bartonella apis]OLY48966.1 16S rRNA (uracil1498-N3)-methyltransferase [Bartonella apis]